MQIDKIAFFGDSYCADLEDSYIERLSKNYDIIHMGSSGAGLNFSVEELRTFLIKNQYKNNNVFFVFMNSSRNRKRILHVNGERPIPKSNDKSNDEDFNKQEQQAIKYHELYIHNDQEDKRNYMNAMEAQQWLLSKFGINFYKRFICFKEDSKWLDDPLNFEYEGKAHTDLLSFSKTFDNNAPYKSEYKNHFCPEANKAMDLLIREAINECFN